MIRCRCPIRDRRWQPNGVHDRSQHVRSDVRSTWTDRRVAGPPARRRRHLRDAHRHVHPDGTLDAAIERLPHLVDLGIDFVELLPVNSFNGTHNWGYDGVLWFVGRRHLRRSRRRTSALSTPATATGSRSSRTSCTTTSARAATTFPASVRTCCDDSTSAWGPSINLATEQVRRYILDNAAMWMRDYHVDGLRLDAVHALVDPSPTHILRELAGETATLSGKSWAGR